VAAQHRGGHRNVDVVEVNVPSVSASRSVAMVRDEG
jgi:hypothetical protein